MQYKNIWRALVFVLAGTVSFAASADNGRKQVACDVVIVGGGDGTISAAAGALAYKDAVLGILPLGTANSFARTLGIPLDPITQDSCIFYDDHTVITAKGGKVVFDVDDGKEIATHFTTGKAAIHQNHGLFTVGTTVDEAAFWFLSMDRSCQAQLLAMAAGTPVAAYPAHGPIDIIPGSNAGAIDKDLKTACLACLDLDRKDVRAYAEKFSWRASAEQFVENLQPYPEPERGRFWRRLRRIARIRKRAAAA